MKKDETRRASTSAAENGGSLAVVSALMAERRRYEGWISALEAKRAVTPDHVFTRVHEDYMTRLDTVLVQLTSHADDLRTELHALESRRDALSTEHRKAVDERAEAELRAHVGELTADDWQRTASVSDAALEDLSKRRAGVDEELARTRELLESTTRPESNATVDEVIHEAPAQVARASQPVAAEANDQAAGAKESTASLPTELPASVLAAEQQLLDIEERPSRASMPIDVPAPVPPTAATRKTQGFDELAFLSSVVDTPAGTFDAAPEDLPDETARRDNFARKSREEAVINLDGDTLPSGSRLIEKEGEPLLSGTIGSSSIGRDSIVADGNKSLKCGECGALNYPTEWYCERCGAELASL